MRQLNQREQLLQRLLHLPDEQLAGVSEFLDSLQQQVPAINEVLTPAGPSPQPKQPDWPHAPPHRVSKDGTYFVTTGTYLKQHHFRGAARLELLHNALLQEAKQAGWQLEAWAVFSNHYHFVAHATEGCEGLDEFLKRLHGSLAVEVNRLDSTPQRKVWHNFRETELTFEKSYFARLNYTHQNPVKHGLVRVANQYPWCSAAWFERTATPAQVKTIYSFKTERVNVDDDFEPEG